MVTILVIAIIATVMVEDMDTLPGVLVPASMTFVALPLVDQVAPFVTGSPAGLEEAAALLSILLEVEAEAEIAL